MPKPSAFPLIYRVDDTAIFLDSIQNFRVTDFCCPADLLHLSPYRERDATCHMTCLDFVGVNLGKPIPEETCTHSHLLWSSIIPYLLPPSIMIHGILPVQLTCLTFFLHNLNPSFLWPGTLHFIFHTSPNDCLFCSTCPTIANSFAVVPRRWILQEGKTSLIYLPTKFGCDQWIVVG